MSARTIRRIVLVVCVAGIAGMIVTSILGHNGAAIVFGIISAVAVLCSMVATAVTTALLGPPADAVDVPVASGTAVGGTPVRGTAGDRSAGDRDAGDRDEEQGALVEELVGRLVAGGVDEGEVRDLVREAVRLGKALGPT